MATQTRTKHAPNESNTTTMSGDDSRIYKDLDASLVYLKRDKKYDTEKPFRLGYNPGPGIARTNCETETRSGVTIRDLRALRPGDKSYEQSGFDVLSMQTKLTPNEFYDANRVKDVYYEELRVLLRSHFGVEKVEVLEHLIRKRHATFPVSTGKDYEFLQPTTVVHVDFTEESALEAMANVLKESQEGYSRIQCVNIWKPLRGPVEDWPLGVCDAETIDPAKDLVAHDVVSRTGYTENYLVHHSDGHGWYYLSDQMPDELWLFRQADTDSKGSFGIPHTGFHNTKCAADSAVRESIETRIFVFYSERKYEGDNSECRKP